jgi:hypothetical protein
MKKLLWLLLPLAVIAGLTVFVVLAPHPGGSNLLM